MNETGFILINKQIGITSFDVVAKLRKITGIKKIGHAGTLDPMASGLLICAIGREATKQISGFQGLSKQYIAQIEFGKVSDSYDSEGEIKIIERVSPVDLDLIKKVVQSDFNGDIMQVPPIFSAKKINGKRAYKLARKGQEVKMEPALIRIEKIDILKYQWPILELKIHCSKGTYIRSIANDLGEKLGVGGYLTGLIRTKIGDYSVEKALFIKDITALNWESLLIKI